MKEAESAELAALLDAVVDVTESWSWFPDADFGSGEAIVPRASIIALERAYTRWVETQEKK